MKGKAQIKREMNAHVHKTSGEVAKNVIKTARWKWETCRRSMLRSAERMTHLKRDLKNASVGVDVVVICRSRHCVRVCVCEW